MTAGPAPRPTWSGVFEAWEVVTAELHRHYGIEEVDELPHRRSWSWLRARIVNLLSDPSSASHHAATPAPTPTSEGPP